jgi:hypothetical protein
VGVERWREEIHRREGKVGVEIVLMMKRRESRNFLKRQKAEKRKE